jgi:hypothetical protein
VLEVTGSVESVLLWVWGVVEKPEPLCEVKTPPFQLQLTLQELLEFEVEIELTSWHAG